MQPFLRRWSLLGLLFCAALGPASGARADSLGEARRLYHQFDYEGARVELLRAVASKDPKERAEVYLYLGLIDTVEGDDSSARKSFRDALFLRPAIELPGGTSPKVRALFAEVRARMAPEPKPQAVEPVAPLHPPPPVEVPAKKSEAPPTTPPKTPSPAAQPAHDRWVTVATAADQEPPLSSVVTPSHTGLWVAGAILLGGIATAAAGGYFGLQEQASERAVASDHFQSDALNDKAAAGRNATTADIFYGVAGLLALTGVTLGFAW